MKHARSYGTFWIAVVLYGAAVAGAAAMDRYLDVYDKIRKGPTMKLTSATFFGAGGVEEFVGVAVTADGRVVAVGNSWGPPFPGHPNTSVLGPDRLWNLPLFSVRKHLAQARRPSPMPSSDHPNRTGFMVFYSPDLTRVEQVVRLGWGSANISAIRRMRDGSFVIAGRANRPLTGVACPPDARHRKPLPKNVPFAPVEFEGVTLPGDVYVAKLTPDLKGFAWVWTMEGFGQVPKRLYEGGGGEVVFKARYYLWRISADGKAFRDYSGTPLEEHAHRVRGISPVDGRVVIGGSWLIGTGREPWKQPWMDVYNSDGEHIESYYWWSGPLAGHDDFRLVSDSGLAMVEPLPNGDYLLTGGSDGGNSVFCRHPADLTKAPQHSGLPMSTWGAGAGSWKHFVRFNPYDITDVSYTLWSAFTPTGPGSIYVFGLRGLNDGSLVIMGYASPFLIQTTSKWFHANTHYFREGKPSYPVFQKNGWPKFQGLGGHGNYVAVLNPRFDSLLWSSTIANVMHLDAVATENGLAVVGQCTDGVASDGRTPAFMPYDIADWPGLIAKLTAAAKSASPSPARRVWTRLSESLRKELAAQRPGRKPAEKVREQVLDEFDKILFDDRSFYDAAAWPKVEFDRYERDLFERLRAGTIGDEELGYLNRALFEQGFPDHVFARPKHNITPAVRAVQAGHGGGVSDGYIYFLKTPPGRRLDLVSTDEPDPVKKEAPKTHTVQTVRKKDGVGSTQVLTGEFEFPYKRARRRALRLPGHCTSYVILRNPGKLKPMFLHGWGEDGAIKVSYDNGGGLDEDITIKTSGAGTLLLNGVNTKPAADWERFACGEWLLKKPDENPLRVTVNSLREWKEMTGTFGRLISPSRGMMKKEEIDRLAANFQVKADVTFSVGKHVAKVTDVPCSIGLKDLGGLGKWAMRMALSTELKPAQLGLTKEGTNNISIKLSHEVFGPAPAAHAAPRVKDAVDEMDDDVELFD